MSDREGVLAPLNGASSTLFLLAGALLTVFAANTGARVFAGGGYPAVHSFVGPAGFFVGLLGLIGVYPALGDRTPVVARIVALVAAIPLVGWFVLTVFGVGNAAGVLPDASVALPMAVPVVVFLTTVLAYVLFGVASLRAGAYSQTAGLALLAPALPFLALIVGIQALGPVAWAEFAIDTGHALAHLAVGVALRTAGVQTERPEPAPDATP